MMKQVKKLKKKTNFYGGKDSWEIFKVGRKEDALIAQKTMISNFIYTRLVPTVQW
jgi:hypothetical protein